MRPVQIFPIARTLCPCGQDHSAELLAHKISLAAGTGEVWVSAPRGDVENAPPGSPEMQTITIPGEVAGSTLTGTTLVVGDSVVSQIEISGDQDWYAIQLQAGVTYEFRLTGTGADIPKQRVGLEAQLGERNRANFKFGE